MRERFVTRTIKTAVCDTAILDTETVTVTRKTFEISDTIPEEKRLAYISKRFGVVAVKILSVHVDEWLGQMTEEYFCEHCEKLPPRSVNKDETEEG